MRLSHIEEACTGQFVWSNSSPSGKILQTNPEIEGGSTDTALIVFVGLSEMYGFKHTAVAEYLAIEPTEYYRLLRVYRQKMEQAHERINAKQWDIEKNDLTQKVWIKTKLLQNRLRLQDRDYSLLSDLPNI